MRPRAWDEGLGTGIDSVDAEHRLQVGLVNSIEEVLRSGGDRAAASATLTRLSELSAAHFQAEEHLMRLQSYPQLEAHAVEHARLLEEVGRLRRGVESDDRLVALEHAVSLRSWLTSHIRSMDQGFALWCARSGVRPEPARK